MDEENFLDDIVTLLKSKIDAKVTEINTLKNDSITLETIPSERFIETLNEDALNWPIFIYYGIDAINSNGIGPTTAREITVFFDIIFMDDQSSLGNIGRKSVQRYTRALREIIEDNYRAIKYASINKVDSVSPVNLRDVEDSNYYKVAGVEVKATIG